MTDEIKEEKTETPPEPTSNVTPEDEAALKSELSKILDTDNEPEPEAQPEPAKSVPDANAGDSATVASETKPSFDERLLVDAERVGISRDEALSFGSPEALNKAIDVAIRTYQRFAQPQQEPAKQEPEPEIEFDPEEYDEKIIKAFELQKKQIRELQDELQAIRGTTQDIASRTQLETQEKMYDVFDQDVNELGNESLFGKGNRNTVAKEQVENRARLLAATNALADSYELRGLPIPPDLIERAMRAEFGESAQAKSTRELADKVSKRAAQSIARPSGRGSTPFVGTDTDSEAKQAIAAILEEAGVSGG